MKLWHKVYLVTLAVALILTNVGSYAVFHISYQQSLEQEKSRVEAHGKLIYNLYNFNLVSYEQRGVLSEFGARRLGRNYAVFYQNRGMNVQIWLDERCIYAVEAGTQWEDLQFTEEGVNTYLGELNGEKYVYVTQRFSTKENYSFCYQQSLAELEQSWEQLVWFYIGMSGGISLLLAVLLGIILQRLMKPIQVLTDAVVEMRRGNYASRVKMKGRDDIARLGEQFNFMAETICENMEEIQQESEAKQRFVDNFSHELKSPLTSIYGFAEYLQRSNASKDEQMECLEYIMEESERLKKMSFVLLEMERLHGDSNALEMEVCDCAGIQETVQQELQMDLDKREITLEWQVNSSNILGNKMLLEVLITNLARNGLRACSAGGKIQISMEDKCIQVRDNGCGMTPENVKHAMEPFYRADKARSRKDGGTGLGLSLCRQIAQVHGGTLTIESQVGVGTTVTFRKLEGDAYKEKKEETNGHSE